MSEPITTISRGLPVGIGEIDRELKRLWELEHGAATRASLVNLVVYCEGAAAMDETTPLIAELTRSHACRAILIATDSHAREKNVQAWISAHCHPGGSGGTKQICCEQITLLLEGDSCDLFPNIVFSHLDSDLPLYLWWRARFSDALDDHLLGRVDRLIFDSQSCSAFKGLFHQSLAGIAEKKPRLVLCDLNWTRTLCLRQALAKLFDAPDHLALLRKIDRVTLAHPPVNRCTALLLAGWLVAQLGWIIEKVEPDNFTYRSPETNGTVQFISSDSADGPIGEFTLCAGKASFRIVREPGSDFLHASTCTPDGCALNFLLPPDCKDVVHLLNEELMQGGRHQVYLRALAAAEPLWEANFKK